MLQGSEHDFENDMVRLFEEQGYDYEYGPNLERKTSNPVLENRLVSALERINNIDRELAEKTKEKIKSTDSKNLRRINRNKYKEQISTGVQIETDTNGDFQTIYPVDFDNPENNDFLIVNQFPIRHQNNNKQIPDLVLFVNGLPFGVIELKGTDKYANSLEEAHREIKDQYIEKAPNLFYYNQFVAVASRDEAKVGSYTAPWEWMLPWRYIEEEPQDKSDYEYKAEYASLVEGFCERNRLVDIIQNFVLYEEGGSPEKVIPTYYQYYGVKSAVESSVGKIGSQSSDDPESRRLGIFSHSQGSGKSISIAYYIKYLSSVRPRTLFVVLTDTNDLDDQIHEETLQKFGINSKHISDIRELRKELKEYQAGGSGVITTTIQKFQLLPSKRARKKLNELKNNFNQIDFTKASDISEDEARNIIERAQAEIQDSSYISAVGIMNNSVLDDVDNEYFDSTSEQEYDVDESYLKSTEHPVLNEREDIVVVSDEAHRSQDEDLGLNLRTALPNSSQIGFTATPIYEMNKNVTAEWFGKVVSSYRMDQAVDDGAVVEIDYEKRAPEINVDNEKLKKAYREHESDDKVFEKVSFEHIIKQNERKNKIVDDIISQFNNREINGKAMLVAYDRETAAHYEDIFRDIAENSDMNVPEVHAIMSSPEDYHERIKRFEKSGGSVRRKGSYRSDMEDYFKDKGSDFDIAIVCDKWTTGFNVEHLHTMYLDKPMRSHNLIQTLGRVNRLDDEKESGLVVDYIGVEETVKRAFSDYTTDRDVKVNVDLEEVAQRFKNNLNNIEKYIEIPDDIDSGPQIDNKVEQVVSGIGRDEAFKVLNIYSDVKSDYRRIHPSSTTEPEQDKMYYIARVCSRLKSIYVDTGSDGGNDGDDEIESIDDIVDESLEAEEAVQVSKIEQGEIVEGINNPDIEIQRAKRGIERKLERNNSYSLKTYDEVKESIEEVVDRYNDGIIDEKEAEEELETQVDRLEEEEKRADKLDLNRLQLSHYDVLDSYGVEDKVAKKLSKEIDSLMKQEFNTDWVGEDDMESGARYEVYKILKDNCDCGYEVAKEIVENCKRIY